jgi:Antibiotic biosynthesis monooxygenase
VSTFNVVRFRVKPGAEQRFVDAHRNMKPNFKGFIVGNLVRTGDQTFCMIGEWRNLKSLVAARPQMIGLLDGFRDMLEDLGGGLGLTDPVSGESVAKLVIRSPAKKAAKAKKKTKKKKKKSK